ncbi:hypothetical protein [Breznakia pachnodae]|uniref:Uncharacterized protein n=1 Tax=Breznakia pachnodae TaxID=265178 RepID=A0ABU0E4F5_9FIRM|nr:hypothetical protein [Breznakia pachnodae]MDQ0361609.1 hypothetical protein [Breznakia pachnodae]
MQLTYELFLEQTLNGNNYHQLEIFKEIDIIAEDPFHNNVYVKYDVLHRDEFFEYYNRVNDFIIYSFSIPKERFLKEYDQFVDNYKYTGRNARYAVQLKILYPKGIVSSRNKRISFLKEYVKQLIGIKVNLPYTVQEITIGKANYALITIIEREFLGKSNYKYYQKDVWIDSRTGSFPKSDCPEEFKVLKRKKGDIQKDKNGKLIPNERKFSTCVRVFRYGMRKDGTSCWDIFINDLKNKLINSLKRIFSKKAGTGKVLHKRQCKKSYHPLIRRRLSSINYAKQTIEYTTNWLLKREKEYLKFKEKPKDFTIQRQHDQLTLWNSSEWRYMGVEKTKAYKQIESIFEKFRSRFKKEEFHDNEGNVRKIQHCYQRVDELEENIHLLIKMFFEDISAVQLSVDG